MSNLRSKLKHLEKNQNAYCYRLTNTKGYKPDLKSYNKKFQRINDYLYSLRKKGVKKL